MIPQIFYYGESKSLFKGLDLVDRVPEELWIEVHDIVQETVIETIPRKTNAKKQNGCLRRPYKQLRKQEKEKAKNKRDDISIRMQSSKEQQGEIRKPSSVNNAKKQRERNNRMGKTRDLFKKIRATKGPFHARTDTIKDRNGPVFWQEYTEELYERDLHDPDNHDGVITDLEPDILECEVKWALGSITTN